MDMLHYWPMIFLIPEQYHFCETRCEEQRRTILSHMRYNSPVDRKAEQGDSDGRETARKAGLGKSEIPLCSEISQSKET